MIRFSHIKLIQFSRTIIDEVFLRKDPLDFAEYALKGHSKFASTTLGAVHKSCNTIKVSWVVSKTITITNSDMVIK